MRYEDTLPAVERDEARAARHVDPVEPPPRPSADELAQDRIEWRDFLRRWIDDRRRARDA